MPSELINLMHAGNAAGGAWEDLATSQTTKMVMSATGWGVYYTTVPNASASGLPAASPSGDVAWANAGANVIQLGHNVQGSTIAAILFTDLDNTKTYDIDVYSNNPSGRFTKFRVNSGSWVDGPSGQNDTTNVGFTGVVPSSGQITLEYQRDGVSFACYANAIRITEVDAAAFAVSVDSSTPTVGDTVTLTFTNANDATGKTVTLNGQSVSFATEDINGATLVIPALHTLGGSGNLYETALDLVVTDSAGSDTVQLTISPESGSAVLTITEPLGGFDADSIFPSAADTGDLAWWKVTSGAATMTAGGLFTDVTPGSVVQVSVYDQTDGLWSTSVSQYTLPGPASSGRGLLRDAGLAAAYDLTQDLAQ